MLDAAADAFAALSARLGAYPHPVYKVVQSAGGYGMESPGLTWIPTGVGTSNLRYLAAHETAHQWFYGIVGNDQSRQPFADERPRHGGALRASLRRASRCTTTTLDRTIYQYTANCYYEAIYIQGGNLLDTARQRMGSSAYWTAVRGYIAAHRNGIATTQSLLQALDAGTPLNLGTTLFAPRFPSIY
jgi:aminopeptidase N